MRCAAGGFTAPSLQHRAGCHGDCLGAMNRALGGSDGSAHERLAFWRRGGVTRLQDPVKTAEWKQNAPGVQGTSASLCPGYLGSPESWYLKPVWMSRRCQRKRDIVGQALHH